MASFQGLASRLRSRGASAGPGELGTRAAATTIVAGVAVLAVILVLSLPAYEQVIDVPWAVVAVAFFIAELATVGLFVRGVAVPASLVELVLVVGFYLVAPGSLVLASLAGSGAALAVRARHTPFRAAHHLAVLVLSTTIGIVVFRVISGDVEAEPISPPVMDWFAATFAGAAAAVIARAVIVWLEAAPALADTGKALLIGLLMALVSAAVGLLIVVLLGTEVDELWLLAGPAALGLVGYRAFGSQRLRQARLEFLYACATILEDPRLTPTTLERLLAEIHLALPAGYVEIMLEERGGSPEGTLATLLAPGAPTVSTAGADVVATRRALLESKPAGGRLEPRAAEKAGIPVGRGAFIVPVRAARDIVGTLVVTDRADVPRPLGGEDLRVLVSVGSRLGMMAANAGLLVRLGATLDDVSKLAAIVQSSDDAIVAIDADGRVTAWNEAASRLFGHDADEMLGQIASERLSVETLVALPSEGQALRESFADVLAGTPVRNVRLTWFHDDGRPVPLSITVSPIRGTTGAVIGASAIVRDETVRARAEETALAAADQLRTVIDGSPVGMGMAGADHRWIRANPALCASLGFDEGSLAGRLATEQVHPDDAATIEAFEERLFADQHGVRSIERRYLTPGGSVVWAELTGRRIWLPGTSEAAVLYTFVDITERRRLREQARVAEERFRRAASAISAVQDPSRVLSETLVSAREILRAEYGAILTFTSDGTAILDVEADGIDPGDLLERLGDVWTPGDGRAAPGLGRPFRLPGPETLHLADRLDGVPRHLESLLAVPIAQERSGRTVLFLADKRGDGPFSDADVEMAVALATQAAVCLQNAQVGATARRLVVELDRANGELVRANDAKNRFLASVAHELRTPLHSILVAAALVHDPPAGPITPERVRDLGVMIESSGRHMVSLIDDLVDLARIEAGRLELRLSEIAVGTILADVESSLASMAQARGITLEFPERPGPVISADPTRVRQIITNLVVNAIKFTERGGRVWVDMSATRSSIKVSVSDTGIGIDAADLERAFLPFEQVSRTGSTGAGLGLAICRSLAELHGGQLEATSVPDQGSCFSLVLPRHAVARPRLPAAASTVIPHTFEGAGQRILIVEDDPTAMGLVADLLRMTDYEVWQAGGLAEATERLAHETPDLVLLDLRLGDGSGLDLIRSLRADPATRALPVLVVSADAMPDDAHRATQLGASGFLAKPVNPRVLLARIDELAGGGARPMP